MKTDTKENIINEIPHEFKFVTKSQTRFSPESPDEYSAMLNLSDQSNPVVDIFWKNEKLDENEIKNTTYELQSVHRFLYSNDWIVVDLPKKIIFKIYERAYIAIMKNDAYEIFDYLNWKINPNPAASGIRKKEEVFEMLFDRQSGKTLWKYDREATMKLIKEEKEKKTKIFFSPSNGQRLKSFEPNTTGEWREWNTGAAWLYNPWTGKQRNVYDIASDPFGFKMPLPNSEIEAARVTEWKPISSAPKNKWILAIIHGNPTDEFVPGVIIINDDGSIDTADTDSSETLESWPLTHWMDLPPRPKV